MLQQCNFDDSVTKLGWHFSCDIKEKCQPVFDNYDNAFSIYEQLVEIGIIDISTILDINCVGNWFSVTFNNNSDIKTFIYNLTIYINQKKESFQAVLHSIEFPDGSNSVSV